MPTVLKSEGEAVGDIEKEPENKTAVVMDSVTYSGLPDDDRSEAADIDYLAVWGCTDIVDVGTAGTDVTGTFDGTGSEGVVGLEEATVSLEVDYEH